MVIQEREEGKKRKEKKERKVKVLAQFKTEEI